MTESATLAAIRIALGTTPGLRLFRNQTGALRDASGRLVTFGLVKGGADLIGYRTVTVTQEMVGKPIAIFAAIEVKTASGRVAPSQQHFLDVVSAAGGIAAVARSPEQALAALGIPA